MYVTHYRGRAYLTLIDCGPSRFALWRPLRLQSSTSIIRQLEEVFFEHDAPEELLTDNDPAFRSKKVAEFARQWGISIRFRCAHVPSGNGIVERCHRTIKVIAARKACSVAEAVYLHNITPKDDCSASTSPANVIHNYTMRIRGIGNGGKDVSEQVNNPYCAGDEVWVRPHNIRCTGQYIKGVVTRMLSDQAVEIDGVPRHVRELR